MIYLFTFYFIYYPIAEYFIHLILHKTNNWIHKKHHIKYHSKTFSIEKTPIILASIFTYIQYYHSAICLLIYWNVHTLIHLKPHWIPKLYKHHHLHHIHNNCNYSVSFIWPDILFRTIRYS